MRGMDWVLYDREDSDQMQDVYPFFRQIIYFTLRSHLVSVEGGSNDEHEDELVSPPRAPTATLGGEMRSQASDTRHVEVIAELNNFARLFGGASLFRLRAIKPPSCAASPCPQ